MGMGFTQPFRHVIWIKIWEWDQFVTPGLLPQIPEFIVTEHCHAWYRGAALQWRHNGNGGVWNHQPYHCLLNCLFGRRSKKTSKLRVAGLCVRNSPGTGEFPAQMASNAENVSIGHLASSWLVNKFTYPWKQTGGNQWYPEHVSQWPILQRVCEFTVDILRECRLH